MRFVKMYEKISALAALEIFGDSETMKTLEDEFQPEFEYLNNMRNEQFSKESEEEQFNILRIYDVFYRAGIPLIDDKEYDTYETIYKSNSKYEEPAPIMFEPNVAAWKKEKHELVMGSLSKATTIEEIEKWNAKPEVMSSEKVISEKLDGISLELLFKNGKFTKAITRGDGKIGEDITANAIYFDGVVKELSENMDCAIRGELVIKKEDLHAINDILVSEGKDPLKNTRNGVAGLATKFKGRNEKILSMITFMAYEINIFSIEQTGETVV